MKKNKNILKYAEKEARKGKRLTAGSKELKIFSVFYCIFAAYQMMMCMVVMFGNLFTMMEYADKTTQSMVMAYNEERMYFITLCIAVFIIIVSFVLLKFKKYIPFATAVCVNCIVIFSVFLKASLKNDIKNGGQLGFWGPFGIPCLICAALALFIMIMNIIDTYRVNAVYNRIVSKLYNKATSNDDNSVDYDKFDEILDAYRGEEIFDESKPLKKSQKIRKEKQDEILAELDLQEEIEPEE